MTNTGATTGYRDNDENLPEIQHDPNITDSQRDRQREERIAAAEARMKKTGVTTPKKKKQDPNAPLVGPNSQPAMRWTAG